MNSGYDVAAGSPACAAPAHLQRAVCASLIERELVGGECSYWARASRPRRCYGPSIAQ
jgi:hypothetical protein